MKVPKKITPTPSTNKRRRTEATQKDNASEKWPRKEKSKTPRKSKKVIQPEVERHHKNANDPQSSSQAHFSTIIAKNFLNDPDPKTMVECKKRSDWNKWKEAIEGELNSLKKRNVFIEVKPTPPRTFHVEFKRGFVRKRNDNNEEVRYKARLVA
jgi:hypothetical protein